MGRVFPQRALLRRGASLGFKPGGPAPRDGHEEMLFPRPVVVVEQRDRMARFVVEIPGAALLLWAERSAFQQVPTVPTRLALRPGVYPQGLPWDPDRDQVGVWVAPGWNSPPLREREGWIEVEIRDMQLQARGWLDASKFGPIFEPVTPRRTEVNGGLLEGSWFRASGGVQVARFAFPEDRQPEVVWWVEPLGEPRGGVRKVHFSASQTWVHGYVAQTLFKDPPEGTLFGRPGTFSSFSERGKKKLEMTLEIEHNTDLFDGPTGALCGRTRQPLRIPDRLPLQVENGRREVEVSIGELGLMRVWVEVSKVHPAPSSGGP